ncbi:N-acetylneuraminate synthase family protein [Candidatus Pelagibacter sp.]|nr:N-acetylneuraminate synthase family protein [Candidatus Pelagibacter sp.]
MKFDICFEIGLAHMGSVKELNRLVLLIIKSNLNVAITLQIREESYYTRNKSLHIKAEHFVRIQKLCKKANLELGFGIGLIEDLNYFKINKIKPSFIKVLSIATKNLTFVKKVSTFFDCPVYYSVGRSSIKYISKNLMPILRKHDQLMYTSFDKKVTDQNFKKMELMKLLTKNISYTNHFSDTSSVFKSIIMGAKKVFVYTGNMDLDFKDKPHAIDIKKIKSFYKICNFIFKHV